MSTTEEAMQHLAGCYVRPWRAMGMSLDKQLRECLAMAKRAKRAKRALPARGDYRFIDERALGASRTLRVDAPLYPPALTQLLEQAEAGSLPFRTVYVARLAALSTDALTMTCALRALEDAGLSVHTGENYNTGVGQLIAIDPGVASYMPALYGPGYLLWKDLWWSERGVVFNDPSERVASRLAR